MRLVKVTDIDRQQGLFTDDRHYGDLSDIYGISGSL